MLSNRKKSKTNKDKFQSKTCVDRCTPAKFNSNIMIISLAFNNDTAVD